MRQARPARSSWLTSQPDKVSRSLKCLINCKTPASLKTLPDQIEQYRELTRRIFGAQLNRLTGIDTELLIHLALQYIPAEHDVEESLGAGKTVYQLWITPPPR